MFFKSKKAANEGLDDSGQFGKYFPKEMINRGGMADIWLAMDKDNQPCALRRLHENLEGDSNARKRFVAGCEALQKVSGHPNVIGYFDHGKVNGTHFLTMEYVEGSNLKLMYADHDPVLLENVANIVIDTAMGLEHVHECGYMHLDFKPENVLVTRNASVRLADFDLAQPIPKEPKKQAKNPGTPGYMSPEQLSGEPFDQRADIFAFGVSAYELFTNQKPFPGDTPAEILGRMRDRSGFVTPLQYNPDLPPAIDKLIVKCLQQNPDHRYFFMSLVVAELKLALYV